MPKTSTFAAFLILMKSFLGTGELLMPKAFEAGGWLFSIITIILLGAATVYSILALVQCRRKLGEHSYADMGALAFGPAMALVVQVLLLLLLLLLLLPVLVPMLVLLVDWCQCCWWCFYSCSCWCWCWCWCWNLCSERAFCTTAKGCTAHSAVGANGCLPLHPQVYMP